MKKDDKLSIELVAKSKKISKDLDKVVVKHVDSTDVQIALASHMLRYALGLYKGTLDRESVAYTFQYALDNWKEIEQIIPPKNTTIH